ncbi:MAG: hypothetical protein NC252_06400 [Roseburia sp.]|nr:hypothetical protein [Roseburia sp.]MCM1420587.1 hypothetical protein [Bacteroides sp.]
MEKSQTEQLCSEIFLCLCQTAIKRGFRSTHPPSTYTLAHPADSLVWGGHKNTPKQVEPTAWNHQRVVLLISIASLQIINVLVFLIETLSLKMT